MAVRPRLHRSVLGNRWFSEDALDVDVLGMYRPYREPVTGHRGSSNEQQHVTCDL